MNLNTVTGRYAAIGLKSKNVANHWGASDGKIIGLQAWVDMVDRDADGRERVVLTTDHRSWSDSRAGYYERQRHIDQIEDGVPAFLFIAHDRPDGQTKRNIDESKPIHFYALKGTQHEGNIVYGLLGERYPTIEALAEAADQARRNDALQNVAHSGIGRRAPVKPEEVPRQSEADFQQAVRREGVDPDRPAYVYVIALDDERYPQDFKIGFSQDPQARLGNLQTGNPAELAVYTHSPHPMPARKAFDWEQEVQRRMSEHHVRGEWFHERGLAEATEIVSQALPDLPEWQAGAA